MPVPLEARTFKKLLRLLDSVPRIVEKEEFMKDGWHDAEVEDSNLTVQISLLRKDLGDSPKNSKYIKTVARKGYRFIASLTAIGSKIGSSAAEAEGASHARRADEMKPTE